MKKKVKGYAILDAVGAFWQAFDRRTTAYDFRKEIAQKYDWVPTVVPCTITYEVPKKK